MITYAKNPSDSVFNPKQKQKHMDPKSILSVDKAKKVVLPALGYVTGAAVSSTANSQIAARISNPTLKQGAKIVIPILMGAVFMSASKKEFAKRTAAGCGITAVYEIIGFMNAKFGGQVPFLSTINSAVNREAVVIDEAVDSGVAGFLESPSYAATSFERVTSPSVDVYTNGNTQYI